MKICLCVILKGDSEYDMAERMFKSFMPFFQGLAVAITGLEESHKLKELIKSYKGRYIETDTFSHPKLYIKDGDKYIFADFAEARNVSFKLADTMEGFDWYSWADVDDLIVKGEQLQAVAERAKELDLDSVFITYWYSINVHPDGTFTENDVQIDHLRERLLRPKMFKWISRLHEVAVPIDENYKAKNSVYDFNPQETRLLAWAHATEINRVHGAIERNIKILNLQIKEQEEKGQRDPRTVFYLAKTYFDTHTKENYQLAELLLQEYLESSGWAEERSNAWQYLGDISTLREDHRQAIDRYINALREHPTAHLLYLKLSREYASLGLEEEADIYLNIAMKMDPPKTRTTIGNPLEVKFMAASLQYNRAIKKKDIPNAIYWLKVRNQLVGAEDDGMIKTLESAKLLNDAAIWVFNYCKWLKDTGKRHKIRHVLDSLPKELGREMFAMQIANEVAEPKVWGPKSIVYFASFGAEHFEQWNPENIKKGIHGSETAVIELSKRWVKMGYEVTVFGDPGDEDKVYDGVVYKPWYAMNWNDTFNILIIWRIPHFMDRDIKAKKILVDLHDIASQLDWTDKRMAKPYKVFFKSNYHRSNVPKLPESKAVVLSNGIYL